MDVEDFSAEEFGRMTRTDGRRNTRSRSRTRTHGNDDIIRSPENRKISKKKNNDYSRSPSRRSAKSPTRKSSASPTTSVNLIEKLASLANSQPLVETELEAAAQADLALNNFSLRFARSHPVTYLKVVGHLMVMSELVALLTPAVAMGIQWVTALCDGPPVPALLQLFSLGINCLIYGDCQQSLEDSWKHCIMKQG